jgi:putative addiction module component (TIGR02574 family)
MATDISETLNEITTWPVEDQIELLHQAWDRLIASGWSPQLTDAQQADFDQRLADLDANPTNVLTVEELVENIRRPR